MEKLKGKDEEYRRKFPMLFRNNDKDIDERLKMEDEFPAGGLMRSVKIPRIIDNNFEAISKEFGYCDENDQNKWSSRQRRIPEDNHVKKFMEDLEKKLQASKRKEEKKTPWLFRKFRKT